MTWVDLSGAFSYGSKLTSTQMQNLRDNIQAAFDKDSGAPVLANGYIVEAMYGASSVDRDALKQTIGSTSGSLSNGGSVDISGQDYSFMVNVYTADPQLYQTGYSTSQGDYFFRMGLYNASGGTENYAVRWRYITATDEPFIFALRNNLTKEIDFLWMSDDPPPGYWGLDKEPKDFIWPIIPNNKEDYNPEIIFKTKKDLLLEIRDIGKKDKKLEHEVLKDFELDKKNRLYVRKNLSMV